jgi:lipopolysaccharide biosynthesis glycosyltransferase
MNFYQNTIPITFAANDYFAPYMAVMMQSIMENAGVSRTYRFFVLHTDITPATQADLQAQVNRFAHFGIDFIDVRQHIHNYDFFTANRPDLTAEAYFRLLIPELFSQYDRVIYVDGDMICRADISRLYDIELGDKVLAAARDIVGINQFYRDGKDAGKQWWDTKSNMNNPADYYCDGMVVFNIAEFRKMISTEELLHLAISRKWKCHDQDILNYVTQGKTFFLPYTWNFITAENTEYIPENLKKEYKKAQESAKIIHFAGVREKPWISPVHLKNFEYFWMYATRTPFINLIITRMSERNLIGVGYEYFVVDKMKHPNGRLRFILKCLRAWLFRIKPCFFYCFYIKDI